MPSFDNEGGGRPQSGERLLKLLEELLRRPQSPKRIAVRQYGRVIFLTQDEIDWIEAADNYACLHCGTETHVLRETMGELEARLDPACFVRVHRSTIVNIDRIKELQPWFRGDYRVISARRHGTEINEESSGETEFPVTAGFFRALTTGMKA